MDVDPVKAPKQNAENPNRIYKNAIRGILLNKTKTDKKVRKSIFDRIEGKNRNTMPSRSWINDALKGSSLSLKRGDSCKWDHDLFRSMVSTEPGSMIYVRNLPNDITNDELKAYFELVDPVVSIKIDRGHLTGAHIGFVNTDAAEKACQQYHQKEIKGRIIRVAVSDICNKENKENNRVSIFDRMIA